MFKFEIPDQQDLQGFQILGGLSFLKTQRQNIIVLDGAVDVEIEVGTVRRFSTGEILLVEDITGRGHKSRAVNNEPLTSVFVTLD